MTVDLGPIIGKALENTLDAKGLTYEIADANEIVMKVPVGSDGTPDLSNAYFVSDGEYQIYDLYVSNNHAPIEVAGTKKDVFLTLGRDGNPLFTNYRVMLGIHTLYALHNGQKAAVLDMKCPDANDNPSAACTGLANTTVYVHLRVLKLLPA